MARTKQTATISIMRPTQKLLGACIAKPYFAEDSHGWSRNFTSLRSALRAGATRARKHADTWVYDVRKDRQPMAYCQFQVLKHKNPRSKRERSSNTAQCRIYPVAKARLKRREKPSC